MPSVQELRDNLIDLGLTSPEANEIKGKQNLINKVEELMVGKESDSLFEEVEVIEEDAQEAQPEEESKIPEWNDPGWATYALSFLEDNEKIKGHPKADSLRRLTELLIGTVLSSKTEVPQTPDMNNNNRATVIVTIMVDSEKGVLTTSGSADVHPGNTEPLFARFAVATAETRARGRAFREMLRLINVVTAEELVDDSQIDDPTDKITHTQFTAIDNLCVKRVLDVDVEKFLNTKDIDLLDLNKISRSKAQKLCTDLMLLQDAGVPDGIKGYKPNWRQ